MQQPDYEYNNLVHVPRVGVCSWVFGAYPNDINYWWTQRSHRHEATFIITFYLQKLSFICSFWQLIVSFFQPLLSTNAELT